MGDKIKITNKFITDNPLPLDVINKDAYYKYLYLHLELQEDEDKYYQTSDPDLIVPLTATQSEGMFNSFKHLPVKEQEEIKEKMSEYRIKVSAIAVSKRQAYGTLNPKDNRATPGIDVTRERRGDILEMFGRRFNLSEVHKATLEWGYSNSYLMIKKFYYDNVEEVKQLREKFDANYDDIRLTSKKSRLGELEYLYTIRKGKYVDTHSRDDENQMLKIIDSIKRETEGDLVINGKQTIEIEHTINIQIQQEIMKDFNITALIISRVAGKLNANPMLILSRLANSKYAKFTGFAQPEVSREEDEVEYYSNIVYDLNDIEKKNKQLLDKEELLKALPIIEEAEIVEYESLKDKLIHQLVEKKLGLNGKDS